MHTMHTHIIGQKVKVREFAWHIIVKLICSSAQKHTHCLSGCILISRNMCSFFSNLLLQMKREMLSQRNIGY